MNNFKKQIIARINEEISNMIEEYYQALADDAAECNDLDESY